MKPMTPSEYDKTTTAGQIDKAVRNFRAMLEKHAPEFGSESVQMVLGQPGLTKEMLFLFRKYVYEISKWTIRIVQVDRVRKPKAVLDATGCVQSIERGVLETMPQGEGAESRIIFFQLDESAYEEDGTISDDELKKQYELRGLKPADPFSLSAVNEADHDFLRQNPNATHWKDKDGNWCYATFNVFGGGRRGVSILSSRRNWKRGWWYAGIQQVSPQN